MKILTPTKRVLDTDQKLRVDASGVAVEDAGLPYIVNPFDAIALEAALRIREARGDDTEIVAVGIGGPDYQPELRTALAMGADRAILVQYEQPLDPWNVAITLCELVRRESPDLVLAGKQAVDDDSNQVGQFLAAQLGWPQVTFASRIEVDAQALSADRETDLGIESLFVSLPAVVTCDLRLNEPRYASLPSILKAKKKPIDHISIGELGVSIEPKVELISLEATSANRSCQFVENPLQLIDKLREEKCL